MYCRSVFLIVVVFAVSIHWASTLMAQSNFRPYLNRQESRREIAASWTPQEKERLQPYLGQAVNQWEGSVRGFEIMDRQRTYSTDSLLFAGSSSIRLWHTIESDLPGYHLFRRGYGGAKYSDLAVHAKRILHPHRYRALVLFVANDVSGSPQDKSPQEVVKLVEYIVGVSQKHQPNAKVVLIAVTPTRNRWKVWEQTKAVNAAIEEFCTQKEGVFFVPTESYFLNAQGEPREELFVADKLHLNRDGYRLWGQIIASHLEKFAVKTVAK